MSNFTRTNTRRSRFVTIRFIVAHLFDGLLWNLVCMKRIRKLAELRVPPEKCEIPKSMQRFFSYIRIGLYISLPYPLSSKLIAYYDSQVMRLNMKENDLLLIQIFHKWYSVGTITIPQMFSFDEYHTLHVFRYLAYLKNKSAKFYPYPIEMTEPWAFLKSVASTRTRTTTIRRCFMEPVSDRK